MWKRRLGRLVLLANYACCVMSKFNLTTKKRILTGYRVHTSMYYYVIRGNQNPRGVQRESPSRLEEGFW